MNEHLKNIWNGEPDDPKPIIYLGGNPHKKAGRSRETAVLERMRFCCLSYFDLAPDSRAVELLRAFRKNKVRAFLDSGAFSYQMSAIKSKKPLDQKAASVIIDRYAEWVLRCDFAFDFIVTFDYKRDPEVVTWANARLEERGLHPIPVYHAGSSLAAFQRLLDAGYTLIGIGGLAGNTDQKGGAPTSGRLRNKFLEHVFHYAEKYQTRLHGFGIGGQTIAAFPWGSVDSTSWLHYAKRGLANRPSRRPGRLFDAIPATSLVSSICPKADDDPGNIKLVFENIEFWSSVTMKPPRTKAPLF